MKKIGFTIMEIVLVIFIFVLASFLLVHFISNGVQTQATYVAKWKTFYKETEAAYKVYLFQKKMPSKDFMDEDATFNEMQPYLNLKDTPKVENYKYKLLNGKNVNYNDNLYFTEFAYTEYKSIVGFKLAKSACTENDEPCASIIYDANGAKKPNKIGVDIFGLNIYKHEIHPWGYFEYINSNKDYKSDCAPKGTGVTCSYYYLIGGKFY